MLKLQLSYYETEIDSDSNKNENEVGMKRFIALAVQREREVPNLNIQQFTIISRCIGL